MDDRCGNCGHGPEYHDNGLLCIECDCRRYRNTLRSTKPSLTRIAVDHVPGMRVQKSTIPGAVPDCYTPTCSCGWVGEREYDEVPARNAWIAHATIADSESDTPADTTTGLPVRADSPDSHPEHDDPSRTGREATTNLPAGEGWKSMPIETLLEIGALMKSAIETEHARIKRIIEGMELRDDLSRIILAAIDKERDDV